MQVKNKVAIVTGGAGGLGSETARIFHEAGVKVAVVDFNEEGANKVAASLGGDARAYVVNIVDEESAQTAIDQIHEDFGAIHICCNIAGGAAAAAAKTYSKRGPHSLSDFAKTVDLNVVGTFNMMRLAAEKMALNEPLTESGEKGVVINTASVAGIEGQMGQISYAAGKAGIIGMTINATRDLSAIGIRVNTIVPGIMGTDIMLSVDDHIKDHLLNSVEFPKRFGQPSEFARMALFMAEMEYLNGECIRLDGGLRSPSR